jgi:hypothetical protein
VPNSSVCDDKVRPPNAVQARLPGIGRLCYCGRYAQERLVQIKENSIVSGEAGEKDDNTERQENVPSNPQLNYCDIANKICMDLKCCCCRIIAGLNKIHGLITAISTILLVGATISLAVITNNTNKTQNKTLVTSTRAWLAPAQAEMESKSIPTGKLDFSIQYGNVGKEPALGFVAQEDIDFVVAPNSTQSLYAIFPKSTLKDVCARTHAVDGAGTIYPSGLRDYTYFVYATAASSQLPIISDVVNGTKSVFIHGCFAYKTFGVESKSEYCFLRLPKVDPDTKAITFRFVRCPYGNDTHEIQE